MLLLVFLEPLTRLRNRVQCFFFGVLFALDNAHQIYSQTVLPEHVEDVPHGLSLVAEGFLDADETYGPERRTKFESYAISKIRWSILDELRRADPPDPPGAQAGPRDGACQGSAGADARTYADRGGGGARAGGLGSPSTGRFWTVAGGLRWPRSRPAWSATATFMVSWPIAGPSTRSSAVSTAELRERLLEAIKTLGEKERVG